MLHRSTPAWVLMLALLPAVAACDPSGDLEPPRCQGSEPPILELGTGDVATGFRPLADGALIHAVMGPQGLHMLFVSLRVDGYARSRVPGVDMRLEASASHDGEVVAGALPGARPAHLMDRVEYLGIRVQFDKDTAAEKLAERLVDVHVAVGDGCERRLKINRKWRVRFLDPERPARP